MVQKIINWSDRKMVFVPSANPIPKKAVAVSTSRISYLHDEEVVDGEQTESDSLRKRTRKKGKKNAWRIKNWLKRSYKIVMLYEMNVNNKNLMIFKQVF